MTIRAILLLLVLASHGWVGCCASSVSENSPSVSHGCRLAPVTIPEDFPSVTAVSAGVKATILTVTEDRGFVFSGKDGDGHPWSVEVSAGPGYECFVGDLDANDMADIVFVAATGANGNLPNAILNIITFEPSGRPVLFQAWSRGDFWEKDQLTDIADLDNDGKCELVLRELRNDGGKDKFDAFLVTTVYTSENARWKQLSRVNDRTFPILTKWQRDGISDRLPASDPPTDGRQIPLADLSNVVARDQGSFVQMGASAQPHSVSLCSTRLCAKTELILQSILALLAPLFTR